MADNMDRAQRSRTMSKIRSSGNRTTELSFIKLLRESSLKGWRRNVKLAGRPDFIFLHERVAVFLDGCFWHGCPRCDLRPKSNIRYWKAKIAGNVARDRTIAKQLEACGWSVVRIWEHQIRRRPAEAIARLSRKFSKPSGAWVARPSARP